MCKCLLWLKAKGQVQGLRSVTSSQCLSYVTTLKTVTHPWFFVLFFFFFPLEMNFSHLRTYEVVTLCDNMTLGYCFNTCRGWWEERLAQKYTKGEWSSVLITLSFYCCVYMCVCVTKCTHCPTQVCEEHYTKNSRKICGFPLELWI